MDTDKEFRIYNFKFHLCLSVPALSLLRQSSGQVSNGFISGKILFFFITIFLFSFSLFADTYHNINNFFGDRASGLAGAYTAISDDPSGAFYNPAGMAFAHSNFISISASLKY